MRNGQWPIGARIGVLLLTGFVFGCSGNSQLVRHQTPLGSSGPESVAIADMQYLHVLEETPHDVLEVPVAGGADEDGAVVEVATETPVAVMSTDRHRHFP